MFKDVDLPAAALPPSARWMKSRGWKPMPFQRTAWKALAAGKEGIVNAPTGSGKTYSLLLPILLALGREKKRPAGVCLIWISPIRALTKEIYASAERVILENSIQVTIGIRTGDTGSAQRSKQSKNLPDVLITTPESLHVLISRKNSTELFGRLRWVVADEWHDLMGTKRGVMTELALAWLRHLRPGVRTWGISATIGNLEEAMQVLLGTEKAKDGLLIRSGTEKRIEVVSLVPDHVDSMPWAGHMGHRMLPQVCEIVEQSESTLLFTNVRSQCEWWYKQLVEKYPELAGLVAIHHGSLDKEIRHWVEDALQEGRLKAVVCTSSLDLGVDFGPVETIIQIGGPKGVSRFIQRAGRSGHRPGAISRIYFLPTHSLELIEAAALRQAVKENYLEKREPYQRCFDALVQFLVTLAVGDGFREEEAHHVIRSTFCFATITKEEWRWAMAFITTGGTALGAYPEFHKVVLAEGRYRVIDSSIARRHRLSMGTIVSDTMMAVRLSRSGTIGHIEESFINSLKEEESFWFAGNNLELVETRGLTAVVRRSTKKGGRIPSWQGGRLPLSANMSDMLRRKLTEAVNSPTNDPELMMIAPVIELQQQRSHVPAENEFLIELFQTEDGHHAVFYPFEGRFVHEGLASLAAYRISRIRPMSFSMAYNDYSFELLSDQPIPLEDAWSRGLFNSENLEQDLLNSINAAELARRRFRDIATIAGLLFRGFPGQPVKDRHLQASASLIYQVFEDYDSENLLIRQAYDEVIHHQLEICRMRHALQRIVGQRRIVTFPKVPTPFAFPVMVDRLREKMSSESLEERIRKMVMVTG